MVAAARGRGFEYIAITDHSKRLTMANGLDGERLLRQWAEIDTLNEQIGQLKTERSGKLEKSKELLKTLEVATGQLTKNRADLERADSEITVLDTSLSKRRNEGRSLDKELAGFEVRLAEEQAQISFLINGISFESLYYSDFITFLPIGFFDWNDRIKSLDVIMMFVLSLLSILW